MNDTAIKEIKENTPPESVSNTSIIPDKPKMVKSLTPEMEAKLKVPLPPQAVSPHPSKPYLSSIKAIYVVERLNDVFGIGKWYQKNEVINDEGKMKTIHSYLEIPEYGIYLDNFGGNDNVDEGDAFKGAVTDALTKMASYLGIGMDVYKGLANKPQTSFSRPAPLKAQNGNADGGGLKKATPYKELLESINKASKQEQLDDLGKQASLLTKQMSDLELDLLRKAFGSKKEELKLPVITIDQKKELDDIGDSIDV